MAKAVFYHAGCPVCVDAEQTVLGYLDQSKLDLEIVHLGQQKERISHAEEAGVKSVPALVIAGQTYHINYGASLEDVKNG